MRFNAVAAVTLLPLAAQAANIVLTNDDGWAEANQRTIFNVLTNAGNNVVQGAPAENQSGTGSSEGAPSRVDGDGCEFQSCPPNSPPTGSDPKNARLNYVNSYPVTSMKYGVNTVAPRFFSGKPDIVVSGPNVGNNLGTTVFVSGTVGAASAAADQLSIPGLAFSGDSGSPTSYTATTPSYALLYADLATNLTSTLLAARPAGQPALPANTWLNVNFPAAGAGTSCTRTSQFEFVLSRIFTAVPPFSGDDVATCGNGPRLPTESEVVDTPGCYVSVSVGKANNKRDQTAAVQGVVLQRLGKILSCLPE